MQAPQGARTEAQTLPVEKRPDRACTPIPKSCDARCRLPWLKRKKRPARCGCWWKLALILLKSARQQRRGWQRGQFLDQRITPAGGRAAFDRLAIANDRPGRQIRKGRGGRHGCRRGSRRPEPPKFDLPEPGPAPTQPTAEPPKPKREEPKPNPPPRPRNRRPKSRKRPPLRPPARPAPPAAPQGPGRARPAIPFHWH